ncbi:MAG: DEAD/DEAH box helicase [Polyangiaceae bacterium]|nr:DEAD/DEAH box helicase [Polyangiaceae bacterium]
MPSVIDRWLATNVVRSCLTADRALPERAGSFAPIPEDLAPGLKTALRKRGIESIYTHQARALDAARGGRHVVVSTPTASGKSLCFHLPVLDALAKNPETTALYLYPTKALSRDQEAGIRELAAEASLPVPAVVYDGDTPGDARRAARERTSIVMTNPDMLHAGILPHHASWSRMLAHLKYVVIDELHTYRGVFGSHVSHVLQRLARVAAFHGSKPTFICATATIGNPKEHAARLLGVAPSEVELVDQSGAPQGGRHVFMYNPPVVNAELGIRASYLKSSVRLTADLLRARVPTIVFGPSRNSVEIMLKYLRDALAGELPEEAIMAYRGGYLPDTRRRIERGLREGEILGVVATNALELGIDIGDLDAVVCASYPGTIAGTWQRFGRAGRRGKLSAAILVTASHAIDQYLASNPEYLLDGAIEEARIDPQNTEILIQHLKCAAFELPFIEGEPYASLPSDESAEALRFLANHGVVHEQNGRFHWATDKYPANHVSLRSVGWDNTVIIDKSAGRTLAELDWRATPTMLHEQAIYQHDGEQYQVELLDHENHKAFVTKVEPDYFTTALTNRKVTPLDVTNEGKLFAGVGVLGEVSVVEKVVGFKKIKFFTHENAGYGDVRLPDIQMHTTSFWWRVPAGACLEAGVGRAGALDGLRGILRALETAATIALMCEPRDIGQSIEDGCLAGESSGTGSEFDPTLFLFDNVPGGIGLAARIHEQAAALLVRVRTLLSKCACERGCPQCVGAIDAATAIPTGAAVVHSRKRAAMLVLERLMRADA